MKIFPFYSTISIPLLFSLLVVTNSCLDNDIINPDENMCISTNMRSKYEKDAIRLALRLQQNSISAEEVQIPEALIDRILEGLVAVEKSESLPRDTVVGRYMIHTLPYPAYDELTVEVDTTQAWVKEWMQGNSLTGYPPIDNLMNTYGLQMDGYFSLSVNFAVIKAPNNKPLNIAALAQKFADIEGIINTDFEDTGGDGNNIEVADMGTSLTLTYTVGYDALGAPNNCNGACQFARSWVFSVNGFNESETCPQAGFVQSYGDQSP